jgi:hypothetical protein
MPGHDELRAQFGERSCRISKAPSVSNHLQRREFMERRHFLKLTLGCVAGAAALAASAQAAPLPPISAEKAVMPSRGEAAEPAVVSQEDVDRLKPEEVRWGHHHHGHRHGGWHRHRWHRRHWGWHHRHWHRHRW